MATYYGQTEHHIKGRLGEHLNLWVLTGKIVYNNDNLTFKSHPPCINHAGGSVYDFSVLDNETNGFKKLVKLILISLKG